MATRINTFDDWMDLFKSWQKEIGLNTGELGEYRWEVKLGELERPDIEFGAYAGQKKWENILEVPDQRIRDALLNLIRVQGDTEFASTEQQRYLFDTAPSDYDRQSLARDICEESLHGWQIAYLLVTYFGSTGTLESQKHLDLSGFQNDPRLSA